MAEESGVAGQSLINLHLRDCVMKHRQEKTELQLEITVRYVHVSRSGLATPMLPSASETHALSVGTHVNK